MEAAVHEYYFFGVMADVALFDGVVDVLVDPDAGSVAGVVGEVVVEVVGGLVCPVVFVVEAGVEGAGPDPRKVDTSGASYAAVVSIAEDLVSKTSGATRLHQECRRRVL